MATRIKIKPSIIASEITDVKKSKNKYTYKQISTVELVTSPNCKYDNCTSSDTSHELPCVNIAFEGILSNIDNIECAVSKHNNLMHIWTSMKMTLIINDTEGEIKIKGHNDFQTLTGGDITIFDVNAGTLYRGIIVTENNKLYFKFSNRPILPLCVCIDAVLQFNIYVN